MLKLLFVFLLGAGIGLAGDACHVISGTTTYAMSAWPLVWRSPAWFPLLVGSSVAVVAHLGHRLGLPSRPRTRVHVGVALPALLALYALTAMLRAQAPTVSVVLVGSLALVVWCAWDPSRSCFGVAAVCAVVGPAAEISFVAADLYHYAADSSGLWGVAPWLPCMFFAQGAVASGLLQALTRPRQTRIDILTVFEGHKQLPSNVVPDDD